MPAQYLHGVETIDIPVAGQTIRVARSSIVALIGIAPIGDSQALKICYNATDDAQFGKPLPGFNIPKTLQIIRSIAGSCPVLVVNVFDAEAHTAAVVAEAKTVTNGKLKLAFAPIGNVTVNDSGDDPSGFVKDTDYTLDEYGNFKVISNAIADGTILHFNYSKLDAGEITGSTIIGGIDGGTEVRTGLELFDEAFNTFGFYGKILCSPGYVSLSAVSAALAVKAAAYRAIYLQDAPFGTTVAEAIAGRGLGGAINFNTNSTRAYLLYPYIKTYDDATAADGDYPYSAFMAGVMVKNDNDNGYQFSPSNKTISNATGVERMIEWNMSDANCKANQLNAAGITTVVSGYATGFLTWGNRSAAFPNSTNVKNFISLQRIDDVLTESLEQNALEDLDKPITQAFIDNLRQKGNAFMSKLIQDGAILPGSEIKYNPDDNTPEELANGHIVFERIWMGPTPAERITYKNFIEIKLLNQFA